MSDASSDAGRAPSDAEDDEGFESTIKTRSRRNGGAGGGANDEVMEELPEDDELPDEEDAEMTGSESGSGSGSDGEDGEDGEEAGEGGEAGVDEDGDGDGGNADRGADDGKTRDDRNVKLEMRAQAASVAPSTALPADDEDEDDPPRAPSSKLSRSRPKARVGSDSDSDDGAAGKGGRDAAPVSASAPMPSLKIKFKAGEGKVDDGVDKKVRPVEDDVVDKKVKPDLEELFGSESEGEDDAPKRPLSEAASPRADGYESEEDRVRERERRENVEEDVALVDVGDVAGDGGSLFVITLPPSGSVSTDPIPYDPPTFHIPEGTNPAPARQMAEATVRWRYGRDASGKVMTTAKDSNSRLVRWSDGSLTLLVGSLHFPLTPTAASSATAATSFLLARHQREGLFETVRSLPLSYQLRPPTGGGGLFVPRAAAPRALRPGAAQGVSKVKNIAIEEDPVIVQERAIKAQQEREKLAKKLEKGRERAAGRYRRAEGLDERMLEDDDDMGMGGGYGGGYGGGSARRREEVYEEDDDFIDDSSLPDDRPAGDSEDDGVGSGGSSDSEDGDARLMDAKRGKRSTEEILEDSDDDGARRKKVKRAGRVDSDDDE